MKLYTEEQVSVAINAAKANPEQAYLILAMLTPIELPSGIAKIEIQHQYHSSKKFYRDAGFVNCTKEQYESIKTEIPTCPLNKLVKITPIELPSDEEIKAEFTVGNQIFLDRIHGAKWMRDKIQGGNNEQQ